MIYGIILIVLVFLSYQYDIKGKIAYKETWYFFMLAIFVLIAGLRWRVGIDTTRYLYSFYYLRPDLSSFSFSDYSIGMDPLWVFLNAVVRSIGGRFFVVQLIHAAIVNTLIFSYIRKHSEYIFTCVFFYAITCYTSYNFEIMRGSLSIAICLYANDFIMERKWLKGYALYIVALMFHAQTILIFLMPLLFSIKLNGKGVLILIAAFILGVFADRIIGNYIYLLDNEDIEEKALGYAESEELGVGFGIRSILLNFLPNILYPIVALVYLKKNDKNNPVLRLEPFVIMFIMFMLMKISFRITYRYVEYYTIYVNIFCANFFVCMVRGARIRGRRDLRYLIALLVFIPFLFMRVNYYTKESVKGRFFPYTSVLNRTLNSDREEILYEMGGRSSSNDEY